MSNEEESSRTQIFLHTSVLDTRNSLLLMMMVMAVSPAPFLVSKNQGFDYDRDGLGIGKLFADVDKIEILEIDSVARDHPRPGQKLLLDNIAHELGDIRIEHQN